MVSSGETLALRRSQEPLTTSYRLHHVRVTAVRQLSPSFVRITFVGPELDRVLDSGLDQRIKLILPLGEHGLDLIEMRDDWYSVWRDQPDDRRNPIRTYTARAVRQDVRELDIDIVRHGPTGPAGEWAERVSLGDEVILSLPSADYPGDPGGQDFVPPSACDRLLLVGDETAVPAISSIIEGLPSGARATVVVEVPQPGDREALPSRDGVDVRVAIRETPKPGAPRSEPFIAAVQAAAAELLAAPAAGSALLGTDQPGTLEDIDVDTETLWEVPRAADDGPARDEAPFYAWLAGEASVIKVLRRHLVSELGIDRRCVAFMGYWREGVVEDNR